MDAGKKEMKENFIKYNNIVREKQRKIADELSKYMMEKQKQGKIKSQFSELKNKVLVLEEAKNM